MSGEIAAASRTHLAVEFDRDCLPDAIGAEPANRHHVNVFRADLDALSIHWCAARLSDDERAHCDALPPATQRRAAASRALVRHVLAAYVDAPPASLLLLHGRFGKPYLAAPGVDSMRLHFNAAHSGAAWMLAVSASAALGVDLEVSTRARFPDGIAKIMLSPAERATFEALERTARASFLANAWVAKEALLKLHGSGLDIDPAQLTMPSQTPRGSPRRWRRMLVARDCCLYGWHDHGVSPVLAAIATTKPVDAVVDVELRMAA